MPNAVHWNTKAGKLYAESVQTHLRRKNRKEGIIIMYNAASKRAEEFIDHEEILASIQFAQENKNNRPYIESLIERAADCRGLNHREAMALLDTAAPISLASLAVTSLDSMSCWMMARAASSSMALPTRLSSVLSRSSAP